LYFVFCDTREVFAGAFFLKRWQMKQILVSAVFALLVVAGTAEAQTSAPVPPNMFSTLAACRQALATGDMRFYEPKYFGLRARDPIDGVDRIAVPLESDTCLEMLVVGGRQFVAQREGTVFRARKLADGSLALYARNDCGNPVYGVVYPAPTVAVLRDPVVRDTPLHEALPIFEPLGPVQAPLTPVRQSASVVTEKKKGFCSSKKCRLTMLALGGAAAGYAAWYYWPCPSGTVRR
jgi:hypothetical protein